MLTDVNIIKLDFGYKISIGKRIKPMATIALFFFILVVLTIVFLPLIYGEPELYIIILPASLILLIASYKYLRGFFSNEILYIDKEKLEISTTIFGFGKSRVFDKSDIKNLNYLGFDEYTKHQLDTEHDSHGFGIAEHEVEFLNKRGTISFMYDKKEWRFGVDLLFEEADEIIKIINAA